MLVASPVVVVDVRQADRQPLAEPWSMKVPRVWSSIKERERGKGERATGMYLGNKQVSELCVLTSKNGCCCCFILVCQQIVSSTLKNNRLE